MKNNKDKISLNIWFKILYLIRIYCRLCPALYFNLDFKTSLVIELWNAKLLIVVDVNKKDDSFQEKIISALEEHHVRLMLQIFFDAPQGVSSK